MQSGGAENDPHCLQKYRLTDCSIKGLIAHGLVVDRDSSRALIYVSEGRKFV